MNLTVCIKTFNRPKCLENCVKSIRKYYPTVAIIIADDSNKENMVQNNSIVRGVRNCTKIDLPFDTGLSAGRNCAVKAATTKYSLVIDDDTIFTERTKINRMVDFLEETNYDLVAGISASRTGLNKTYTFIFHKVRKVNNVNYIYQEQLDMANYGKVIDNKVVKAFDVNMALNYFVAKTDKLQKTPWYDVLKVGEHEYFFADWYLAGNTCAYTPDITFSELNPYHNDPKYRALRYRSINLTKDYIRVFDKYLGKFENNCTIIIKTFLRPTCLLKVLKSIRFFYQSIRIIVADDSTDAIKKENDRIIAKFGRCTKINLPFDSGLSAGRNSLIDKVTTPFFITFDDDFVVTKSTKLYELYNLISTTNGIDILAGIVNDGTIAYNHDLKMNGKHLKFIENKRNTKSSYKYCDVVLNFFIAKKDIRVRWNPQLKVAEHWDFFLRCKHAGVKVAVTNKSIISHTHVETPEYNKYRKRSLEYTFKAMKLNNITMLTTPSCTVDLINKKCT